MANGSGTYIHILREIVTNKQRNGQAKAIKKLLSKVLKLALISFGIIALFVILNVWLTNWYGASDKDPERGAMPVANGWFGEDYATPLYIQQGWSASDSLWFYNTTQGSGLLPYDFFVSLEQADSEKQIINAEFVDKFRYLPQKSTKFNPDALPVGFVKDTYRGMGYVGLTCAACHTSQVNYAGQAIRIDGGPSMADMVGFLEALEKSMKAALEDTEKQQRFVNKVIALDNDFDSKDEVLAELTHWTNNVELYNIINHVEKRSDYGYARLDAFGRIYNRVLQHVVNSEQAASILSSVVNAKNERLLTDAQINNVMKGLNKTIMGDKEFHTMLERLQSKSAGYPGLSFRNMLRVRDAFFNEPNAPVSYPFLWDIAQSDYVQWNGLANNAGLGPLGRNTGEVIGVFGILDWRETDSKFNIGAYLSGQQSKQRKMKFDSSIDLHNLGQLESRLKSLQSPLWVDAAAALKSQKVDIKDWMLDAKKVDKGRLIYEQYCESCHELIDRSNWDRLMVAKMSKIEAVGTDPQMAMNSVTYKGYSGNFEDTLQSVDVGGKVVIEEYAPVVQILTSATTGVVGTPDPDKNIFVRFKDWIFTLVMSFTENKVKSSLKAGNYNPDTMAQPYASLLSYKARSLNGIWATAPYLHNGSVPTLYDLLLPVKREGDPEDGEYRPETFKVGKREFDPVKVGFVSEGFEGFEFKTHLPGNSNKGHEYAAGKTAQMDGTLLPALNKQQRLELLEFLKSI